MVKELQAKNLVLWYDSKSAGESSSQPNVRLPPFRNKDLQKWVHALLRLDDEDTLPKTHMVCYLDGGRHGSSSPFFFKEVYIVSTCHCFDLANGSNHYTEAMSQA